MKKITFQIVMLLLAILMISTMSASESNQIDLNVKVRVGLKTLYERVESIRFSNPSLLIGFEVNSEYQLDTEIICDTGFTVTAAKGFYLISTQNFSSLQEVEPKVTAIRGAGYNAYAGLAAHGIWKIYVGSYDSSGNADSAKPTLEGNSGLAFEVSGDNGLRTQITYDLGSILFENSGSTVQFGTNTPVNGVPIMNLGTRSYRGKIEVGRYSKEGVTAINVLSLNEYLYGVVPSEMPTSWPLEALKAQSVAARNFAMYYMFVANKYPNEAYRLCDTVNTQAYKGYLSEVAVCNQAINETTGKLIYFNGNIISANYFSTSGGHTEDSENVWSNATPYLKGVPDLYETEPYVKPWIEPKTTSDIQAALAKAGVNIGSITDVQVSSYASSGRAMTLKIIGSGGSYEVSKEAIRTIFGLKSRKFTVLGSGFTPQTKYYAINGSGSTVEVPIPGANVVTGSGTKVLTSGSQLYSMITSTNIYSIPNLKGQSGSFIFVGQGSGHGAGMSQSGAKGMALAGFTYDEILEYYFTGTIVQ